MRIPIIVFSVLLAVTSAEADSLYLNSGVRVDGKVSVLPNGLYQVTAGSRTVVYRPGEVDRHEENSRTGVIDRQQAMRRFEARDEELTRLTGLDVNQRRRVEALAYRLQREDERPRARNELVALQQEMDVFRFLAFLQPTVSHRLAPWVLEAMAAIDPNRAVPYLRKNVAHVYYDTRVVAIDFLGKIRDRPSTANLARGLVDHSPEVQFVTAYAMANLGARQATPALIELLANPDPRVRNASAEALEALWDAETDHEVHKTQAQWQQFWQSRAGSIQGAIHLAGLTPLIPAEREFQDE